MKISKQERILIVVFLVAAIIGVGIFVFILPNFNKISDNNKQLASVNKQYADINKQLEHESTIDNEISQAYEDGKNLADKFFNDLTEYEADEIMRKFIANGKDITIDGLTISPFSTQALSVSVFSPTEVTYPLKDFANTVVETPDKETDFSKLSTRELVMYAKKLQATLLAASEPVTVGSVTVAFTAHQISSRIFTILQTCFIRVYTKRTVTEKPFLSHRSAIRWKRTQAQIPVRATLLLAITQWNSP